MPRGKPVTRDTYISDLPLGIYRELSLRLDVPTQNHMDWKGMAALLPRRPGSEELKYSALHIGRYELELQKPGGSPTEAVLRDWGTNNARVSDLLGIFEQMEHYSAMEALLPGSSTENTVNRPPPPVPARPDPVLPTAPPATLDMTQLPVFDPQLVQRFSFEEIRQMTRNFDNRKVGDGGTLIDEGGFGIVYRGTFLGDQLCAVKRLKEEKSYEDVDIEKQFEAELKALCQLRHPNLVVLYGYCNEPPNLCLVYELMTGGSLQARLSCKGDASTLHWPQRLSIALDAASGIQYLHERGFIHRDIKSANILLDSDIRAKVCDFGLVRDKSDRLGGSTTHFQTSVTIGSTAYMAPEAMYGQYSKKTDVYSFGLVLLEVLTSWAVYEEEKEHIRERVEDKMEENQNDIASLIDPRAKHWDDQAVREVYDLALRSTNTRDRRRPEIGEIVDNLERLHKPNQVAGPV